MSKGALASKGVWIGGVTTALGVAQALQVVDAAQAGEMVASLSSMIDEAAVIVLGVLSIWERVISRATVIRGMFGGSFSD